MKIPEQENTIKNLIDKHYESLDNNPRVHLGCSELGDKCDRKLWYGFRWVAKKNFEGRILRLFKRGQNEEQQVIDNLKSIGVSITNTSTNQSRVNFGYHIGGSVDGIIKNGLPNAPKTMAVLEIKTHSDKSFKELAEKGVEKAKPLHYAQMQLYMKGTTLDRAVYYAVNKNDDDIHTEYIKYDKEFAEKLVEKGKRITMSNTIPDRMSENSTWYECKFCDHHAICHEKKLISYVNCRNCAHSTPKEDSTWYCEKWQDTIPEDAQREGCEHHVIHPHLMPFEQEPAHDDWHAIYIINNKKVLNGSDGFKSKEIIANPEACAENDEFMQVLRKDMGATVCS